MTDFKKGSKVFLTEKFVNNCCREQSEVSATLTGMDVESEDHRRRCPSMMISVVHRLDQRYRALMCTSRCLCTTTQWTRQNRSRVESSWATKESKTEEPKAETRLSMDKRGQH